MSAAPRRDTMAACSTAAGRVEHLAVSGQASTTRTLARALVDHGRDGKKARPVDGRMKRLNQRP